jgi:hypothetical protein
MVTNNVTMWMCPEWWIYHQYMAIQTGKVMTNQWMERGTQIPFCGQAQMWHPKLMAP